MRAPRRGDRPHQAYALRPVTDCPASSRNTRGRPHKHRVAGAQATNAQNNLLQSAPRLICLPLPETRSGRASARSDRALSTTGISWSPGSIRDLAAYSSHRRTPTAISQSICNAGPLVEPPPVDGPPALIPIPPGHPTQPVNAAGTCWPTPPGVPASEPHECCCA